MFKVQGIARITGGVVGRVIKGELIGLSVVLVGPHYHSDPTIWTVRVCTTGREIALYEDEMEVIE